MIHFCVGCFPLVAQDCLVISQVLINHMTDSESTFGIL